MVEEWPLNVVSAAARVMAMGSWSLFRMLRIFKCDDRYQETAHPFTLMLQPCIWLAAKLGSVRLTEMLISSHKYLTQDDLNTALAFAAFEGKAAVVDLLLRTGADPNAQDFPGIPGLIPKWDGRYNIPDGLPPLQLAARKGHLDVVKLLVEHGANVNLLPNRDGSVLASAMRGPYPPMPILQYLLESGADPAIDADGTALRIAAERIAKDRRPFWCLLEQGGNAYARGQALNSALYTLCAHTEYTFDLSAEIDLLLSKGADPNARDGDYGTALQASCYYGNIEIVTLLLDRGADVNAQSGWYGTALQAACKRHSSRDLVKLLLERGADINAIGGEYGTALQAACFLTFNDSGRLETMKLLLEHDADVNLRGGKYGTALYAAVESGNLESVLLLLEYGADINAEGGEYGTALQAACRCSGRIEIVRLLIERGADVHARGGYYGSAWHAAARQMVWE